MPNLVPQEVIEQKIFRIRGKKVMLDRDLAELYGVETKYLNRQVKRNIERFPEEFMFQLSVQERDELVTKWHRLKTLKHSSVMPHAFTEHGVAMLATVLNSDRAVKVSICIIKVFVKFREIVATHKEILNKLGELENKVGKHDEQIAAIFQVIRQLVEPKLKRPKRRIGFHQN